MAAMGNGRDPGRVRRAREERRAGALLAGVAALLLLALRPAEGRTGPIPQERPASARGTGAPGSGRRLRLAFRGTDIGQVLEYLSIAAEKTLVMAPEASQALMGVTPASAAGNALQTMPWARRVRLLSRPGSLNPGGQVVPEARSNSLVVSAPAANMALVEKLLGRLDRPVHARPTAMVVPLQNARAADVGLLLNQTFNTVNRGSSSGAAIPRPSASPAARAATANPARAAASPRSGAPR